MRKKLWIAVILLAAWLVSQWLTVNAFSDNFREKAEKYIAEMAEVDPFWKWENPKIVWQTPFYDSDDNKPSYIEYKVSCNRDTNCWYVLVNLDGSDVDIPESSSVWKAPSEQMDKTGNWKNYNFWVFEKFSYDENTWDIWYINPGNEALEEQAKQSVFSKNTMSSVKTDPLKEKFEKLKKEAKENKEENVQKQLLNKSNIEERSTLNSYNDDRTVYASNNYINEGPCLSITPCYEQAKIVYREGYYNYQIWPYWISWCVPTAFSILYWFYDRNWFPNLISWYAPAMNNTTIRVLQSNLAVLLDTELLRGWEGLTLFKNTLKWFDYVKNNTNYKVNYWKWEANLLNKTTFERVKWEIENKRPVMLSYTWHMVIAHWYRWKNILFLNLWWWPNRSHVAVNVNANTISWDYVWRESVNYIIYSIFN